MDSTKKGIVNGWLIAFWINGINPSYPLTQQNDDSNHTEHIYGGIYHAA